MTKRRSDMLTTMQLYNLDRACQLITKAFDGVCPYLVGSAGMDGAVEHYRDVDVRLMLDKEEFNRFCPTLAHWELLCVSISTYLSERTGLPIDFQIQERSVANARFSEPRNPLGLRINGRNFAGGGDGTPPWQ